jgi:hypothetical protein
MNQGRRYIRNTVLVLYGTGVLWVGMNRLFASVIDDQSSPGLRNVMSLGLMQVTEEEEEPGIDLAAARDFTKLSVMGRLDLEIVGAEQYNVTFSPAPGQSGRVKAQLEEETLHLYSDPYEGQGAIGTLRIETPALTDLHTNVASLTVSGLRSPAMSLVGFGSVTIRREQ